jgi:hypothetical protein
MQSFELNCLGVTVTVIDTVTVVAIAAVIISAPAVTATVTFGTAFGLIEVLCHLL